MKVKFVFISLLMVTLFFTFQNCGSPVGDNNLQSDSSTDGSDKEKVKSKVEMPMTYDQINISGYLLKDEVTTVNMSLDLVTNKITIEAGQRTGAELAKCKKELDIAEEDRDELDEILEGAKMCEKPGSYEEGTFCTMEYILTDTISFMEKGESLLSFPMEVKSCEVETIVYMCDNKDHLFKEYLEYIKEKYIKACLED